MQPGARLLFLPIAPLKKFDMIVNIFEIFWLLLHTSWCLKKKTSQLFISKSDLCSPNLKNMTLGAISFKLHNLKDLIYSFSSWLNHCYRWRVILSSSQDLIRKAGIVKVGQGILSVHESQLCFVFCFKWSVNWSVLEVCNCIWRYQLGVL